MRAAAQHLIESDLGEPVVGEPDLAPAHERWLGDWARRTHGSEFVFVVGYPMVMPPHGGFAIGLERWIARLTGAMNVREVTLFRRDIHRLTP